MSSTQCFCLPGYFWQNNKCNFSCSDVIFTTGEEKNDGTCECILGWIWEPETRSCACLPFSTKNFDGTCSCIENYRLEPSLNKCVIDCSAVAITNSSGENDGPDKCICNEGFYYGTYITEDELQEVKTGCRKNCTKVKNSKEETIGLDKCLCY